MLALRQPVWTGCLAVVVAMIMASPFSAILVYAQELMPGRVGLVAGMFFASPLAWAGWAPPRSATRRRHQHRDGLQLHRSAVCSVC